MSLSLTEVLAFIPKAIGVVQKTEEAVARIKAAPTVTAKVIIVECGGNTASLLYAVADLVDDIIEAVKT